jgi:hypothetical protein
MGELHRYWRIGVRSGKQQRSPQHTIDLEYGPVHMRWLEPVAHETPLGEVFCLRRTAMKSPHAQVSAVMSPPPCSDDLGSPISAAEQVAYRRFRPRLIICLPSGES